MLLDVDPDYKFNEQNNENNGIEISIPGTDNAEINIKPTNRFLLN
jgi:hypothetical protein